MPAPRRGKKEKEDKDPVIAPPPPPVATSKPPDAPKAPKVKPAPQPSAAPASAPVVNVDVPDADAVHLEHLKIAKEVLKLDQARIDKVITPLQTQLALQMYAGCDVKVNDCGKRMSSATAGTDIVKAELTRRRIPHPRWGLPREAYIAKLIGSKMCALDTTGTPYDMPPADIADRWNMFTDSPRLCNVIVKHKDKYLDRDVEMDLMMRTAEADPEASSFWEAIVDDFMKKTPDSDLDNLQTDERSYPRYAKLDSGPSLDGLGLTSRPRAVVLEKMKEQYIRHASKIQQAIARYKMSGKANESESDTALPLYPPEDQFETKRRNGECVSTYFTSPIYAYWYEVFARFELLEHSGFLKPPTTMSKTPGRRKRKRAADDVGGFDSDRPETEAEIAARVARMEAEAKVAENTARRQAMELEALQLQHLEESRVRLLDAVTGKKGDSWTKMMEKRFVKMCETVGHTNDEIVSLIAEIKSKA